MKKRIISVLMALCMIGSIGSTAVGAVDPGESAYSGEYPDPLPYPGTNYNLTPHNKEQQIAKYQELLFDIGQNVTYERDYSFKNPFVPGEVGISDQLNALNVINFCRYAVGLPDDVQLSKDYSEDAQAVAYLNAFNGSTSYYNPQRDNFPNMLYDKAVVARQKVVIGENCDNMADAVLSCWTTDFYDKNIQGASHRCMAITPKMQKIGFGQAGEQYAVYTYDRSRPNKFVGDYVMWPPEDAPYELFKNGTFAVNLSENVGRPYLQGVTVDVTSQKTGDHWHFSGAGIPDGCHMSVHQDSYDECPSLIFGVDSKFSFDDTVKVKITGLSKNGRSFEINRDVKFYSLSTVTLNARKLTLGQGESYQLEADIFTADTRNNTIVSYFSDHPEVADVDDNGLITTGKTGTATITVQLPKSGAAECTVTVKKPPESAAFSKSVAGIFIGEVLDLNTLLTLPKNTASFNNTYVSSNKKVCTVDSDGKVKALATGPSIITVTTYNGQKASVQVIVSKYPELVNQSKISAEVIKRGESVMVTASATGGAGEFTYEVAYKKASDEKWTTVQQYKKVTKVTITPKAATDYEVRVRAKDGRGSVIEKIMPLQVITDFANTTVLNVKEIKLGEKITINATAEGGLGDYRYAVLYKKVSDTKWTVVQGYKENNIIVVKPQRATDYNICVKVMDSNGMIAKNYFNVTVDPGLTNHSSLSAEEILFGDTVTTYNVGTGGTEPYTYAVLYRKVTDSKWTVVQNYKNVTETVITPRAAVEYEVCVKIKDAFDTISKKYMKFTVVK